MRENVRELVEAAVGHIVISDLPRELWISFVLKIELVYDVSNVDLGLFCSPCFTKLHYRINIFHVAEKWEVRNMYGFVISCSYMVLQCLLRL